MSWILVDVYKGPGQQILNRREMIKRKTIQRKGDLNLGIA